MEVVYMRKRVGVVALLLATTMVLTSCGDNTAVAELKNIEALGGESQINNVSLTINEKESMIYSKVSDRTLLDLKSLAEIDNGDLQAITTYMDSVDSQLTGAVAPNNSVISSAYTDYLLAEFEKTPYYWQRSSMSILGQDASSRAVVVDVTYKTIGFKKTVVGDSSIVLGEPNYEKLLQNRYTQYISMLKTKTSDRSTPESIEQASQDFMKYWGNPNEIIASQSNLSLTQTVYQTGNQKTYKGLIDSDMENLNAEMKIRYIISPQYKYGINQGYTCNHLYLLSYNLESDPTANLSLYTNENSMTIAASIYDALKRYYRCYDECDYSGLYKLLKSPESLDKAYKDVFKTMYVKHDNFDLSIFTIKGTHVECGVDISTKVRAKGSNISSPIYTDRYFYVIDLIDGELKITNEVLLSRTLEGEPAVNTEDVDTSGFSSLVQVNNTSKKEIENLIADFGANQLLGDTLSENFNSLIDLSLSTTQVDQIKQRAMSISGQRKAVWIVSYLTGNTGYASVKCREMLQGDDNSISELSVVYDFINKGNRWYIYDYTIASIVKLDSTDLSTKQSLCVVSKGNVDSLVSQVEDSEENEQELEAVASIDYTYKSYNPELKLSTAETGKHYSYTTMTEEDIMKYINSSTEFATYKTTNPNATAEEYFNYVIETGKTTGLSETTIRVSYQSLAALKADLDAGYINQNDFNKGVAQYSITSVSTNTAPTENATPDENTNEEPAVTTESTEG